MVTCRDPIKVTEKSKAPWSALACNLLGPLPSGDNLLMLVDYHSRWYEVKVTISTTSRKVIDALTEIFDTQCHSCQTMIHNLCRVNLKFSRDMGFGTICPSLDGTRQMVQLHAKTVHL